MNPNGSRASECSPGEAIASGWQQSFKAGYSDSNGHFVGGSEILHLVGHKGKLYAANGYWMDGRNIGYGGKDVGTGWGQILRLDKPGWKWEVDLELGPRHLRPEILKSVSFSTDGRGNKLTEPVQLLMTSTSDGAGSDGITLFVRDDKTGQWEKSKIVAGDTSNWGEGNSVRAMMVHRDRVTGVDRIFISLGVLGIYSGVYDPEVPGRIRWDKKSESGPTKIRPLAIIEADGSLLFSAGALIYRRHDGPSPSYSVVKDLGENLGGSVQSPVGGIRGLSAIPGPNNKGESLLFVWAPDLRSSTGCIYRLDPDGQGGYTYTYETGLNLLMTEYLKGSVVRLVLGGYNDIMPIADPSTHETAYLIGFESLVDGPDLPLVHRTSYGGFYAGAMYAIRDKNGHYRLNEVNGHATACKPVLVSTRTYVLSPFAEDRGKVIYFGGYDGNYKPSTSTAWIFSTSVENALKKISTSIK